MKKVYIILGIILLLAIPISATKYFQYKFKDDITIVCPDCDYHISCQTDSMSPTANCNDTLIATEPSSKKDIKVGDIIFFTATEEQKSRYTDETAYIYHRIIDTDHKGCYITQGDNNDIPDEFHPCYYDIKFVIRGVIYG